MRKLAVSLTCKAYPRLLFGVTPIGDNLFYPPAFFVKQIDVLRKSFSDKKCGVFLSFRVSKGYFGCRRQLKYAPFGD